MFWIYTPEPHFCNIHAGEALKILIMDNLCDMPPMMSVILSILLGLYEVV